MSAIGFAVLAVILNAFKKVIYRGSIGSGSSIWGTAIYYNFIGGLILLSLISWDQLGSLQAEHWSLLILNTVVWVIAYLLDLHSYRFISATEGELYGSIQLVIMAAVGISLFGESLTPLELFGAGLILAAIFINYCSAPLSLNRGAAYKLASSVLVVAAILIDRHLTTVIDANLVIAFAFLGPGLVYASMDLGG